MGKPSSYDADMGPIATLRRLCGAEIADRFHDAFAGIEVSVPEAMTDDNPIAQAIGIEAARALASEFGGCRCVIPGNRDRRAKALIAAGKTISEIARELGITTRGVHLMIKRLGIVRVRVDRPRKPQS